MKGRSALGVALVWGFLVSLWMARGFFGLPAEMVPRTHEAHSYVFRLVEFRDLLAGGYWSPQWATHFRGGLGSPYFGYYQSGFFHIASLIPWAIEPLPALGCAVVLYGLVGFAGMLALVGTRVGGASGVAAGTLLLLAPYPATDLHLRGDLSEYAATMLVPLVAHAFTGAIERGRTRDLALLAGSFGALVCTHPCVTLVTGLAIALAWIGWVVIGRDLRAALRVAAALALGTGLAAFYLFPLAFESHLVGIERATMGRRAKRSFLSAPGFFWGVGPGSYLGRGSDFSIGPVLTTLGALGVLSAARASRELRWLAFGLTGLLVGVFALSHAASEPLWDAITVIDRLQFPWRTLSVGTVVAAALAGLAPVWRWRWTRWIVAAGAIGLLGTAALGPLGWIKYTPVDHAAEIARVGFFAPDIMAEWVPLGARVFGAADAPKGSTGDCVRDDATLERAAGRLRLPIGAGAPCMVVLPHYYFPIGWKATLDGRAVPLDRGPDGLMRLRLPAHGDGVLELRFVMTPMRRLGWLVACCAAGSVIVWLAWSRRGRSRRATTVDALEGGSYNAAG